MKTIKTRPIIFSTESVKQILSGAKTQTRRVMKPQPKWLNVSEYRYDGIDDTNGCHFMERLDIHTGEPTERYLSVGRCPFGKPGDRLWVREAFFHYESGADSDIAESVLFYKDTIPPEWENVKWKSPLFMPRRHSRLTLEITNVRCERVQDITPADVDAEGYGIAEVGENGVVDFEYAWDSLNAKRGFGWDTNPYVWCISFKKVESEGNDE